MSFHRCFESFQCLVFLRPRAACNSSSHIPSGNVVAFCGLLMSIGAIQRLMFFGASEFEWHVCYKWHHVFNNMEQHPALQGSRVWIYYYFFFRTLHIFFSFWFLAYIFRLFLFLFGSGCCIEKKIGNPVPEGVPAVGFHIGLERSFAW